MFHLINEYATPSVLFTLHLLIIFESLKDVKMILYLEKSIHRKMT